MCMCGARNVSVSCTPNFTSLDLFISMGICLCVYSFALLSTHPSSDWSLEPIATSFCQGFCTDIRIHRHTHSLCYICSLSLLCTLSTCLNKISCARSPNGFIHTRTRILLSLCFFTMCVCVLTFLCPGWSLLLIGSKLTPVNNSFQSLWLLSRRSNCALSLSLTHIHSLFLYSDRWHAWRRTRCVSDWKQSH